MKTSLSLRRCGWQWRGSVRWWARVCWQWAEV